MSFSATPRPFFNSVEATALSWCAHRRNRIIGALSLALICGLGFTLIGIFNRERFGLSSAPTAIQAFRLDGQIPFVPGWIWFYLMYYPFCFLPLFLREVRNHPPIFLRSVVAFLLQFGASFVIFLLWPLRMVHPILPPGLDGRILHGLYGFDLGFNSFPSLHLSNIVFVTLLFWRLRGRFLGGMVGMGALLIAVSTLLVKQHFVSDVVTGALLGWATFALLFSRAPFENGVCVQVSDLA
ncbi:MAG TPA: phosphatase PAP2 family protein [Elusimicrobiota bacterium]|nr:phosphatase PAP2 family protein [Elusimicrobiota bacterium]